MKSKTCAYCKREFFGEVKRTAEHIFPQTLLQLYPERMCLLHRKRFLKIIRG